MAAINNADQIIAFSYDALRWLFMWSWQALLVLVIAWALLKIDRSRNATSRFRIWLLAIVVVALLPPLDFLFWSRPAPAVPVSDSFGVTSTALNAPPTTVAQISSHPHWYSYLWIVLLGLWMLGVLVSLARFCISIFKLQQVRKRATPVSLAALNCSYSELINVDSAETVVALSSEIQSPLLVGLFRPVILLPVDVMSWTDVQERISMLRHELAHVKRHDHLSCLIQSVLKSILFFHPMIQYSCDQLSLERELACDDNVLNMGTEPTAYAESILKAVERSLFTDFLHQTASFASKRKLERRIDMILDTTRSRRSRGEWRFVLASLMLIGLVTWLIMPAASGHPSNTAKTGSDRTITVPSNSGQTVQSVNKSQLFIDTVKRGALIIGVRGLGTLAEDDNGRLKAELRIPIAVAHDLELGQKASIDTRTSILTGIVSRIFPGDQNEIIRVDVRIDSEIPTGLKPGTPVDGVIDVIRLEDVLHVGRPVFGQSNSTVNMFKLDEDGETARRVLVKFGRSSVNAIHIVEGLNEGDRVILSDMSAYDGADTLKLR